MALPNANPDLTLNPDPNQVARLLTLTSEAMNTTTDADDGWCGGFEVDVSALSGQRLIVHGNTCQRRDPAALRHPSLQASSARLYPLGVGRWRAGPP